ncbi:MAG TPA: hypothetical protein VNI54_18510 [Thermoanaerobaculia bacterium]|nr:hypothetical protein [Thermoanaerobaculia bacterium]
MPALALYWSDHEWNIHWSDEGDARAAFQLALDVASHLAGTPIAQPTAADLAALWREEQQLAGTVNAAGMQFPLSASSDSEGGQLSLESREGIFGTRYEELLSFLHEYARQRGVRIAAPYQEMTF